jgi:hypothetical protein
LNAARIRHTLSDIAFSLLPEHVMRVDRKWVERNLGFDPIARPPPHTTFAFQPAIKAASTDDLRREIIDFDSESPAGL